MNTFRNGAWALTLAAAWISAAEMVARGQDATPPNRVREAADFSAQAERDARKAKKALGQKPPNTNAAVISLTEAGLAAGRARGVLRGGGCSPNVPLGYSILKFDVADESSPELTWKNRPLVTERVVTPVYETEKVLAVVCHASDTTWNIKVDHSAVLGQEAQNEARTEKLQPGGNITLWFYVEAPTKGNEIETVTLMHDKTLVTAALLERHHVVRFSAGTGVLMTQAPTTSYSVVTLPTTLTITTSVSSTTYTNGVLTSSSTSVSPVITNPTASYQFGQRQGRPQFNAIAGLTFYPFGYDTFEKGSGRLANDYAHRWKNAYQPVGVFAGTSVNQLGNFTAGLSYDMFRGVQVFAGSTWWKKTTARPDVTLCTGIGNSVAFRSNPTATKTENSTDVTTTNGVATTTVKSTTTTTDYSAVSGCVNGNTATVINGSSPLTQDRIVPAFSWGFVFNTNLFKLNWPK